jgi:predicted transport protein
MNGAVFNIPVYQRNYDWSTDNCQQLFNDIETITVTQKDHFIGAIVYISVGLATEPEHNIIDGQQRITSVMLFLKALHDLSDDARLKIKIKKSFLVDAGLDDEPKMKLKQVESDSVIYEKIIIPDNVSEDSFSETEKQTNVYRNYMFFLDKIASSSATIEQLYNAVFKLEIIDVCLTSEDPQEVFESMNSTGKSLTNTDLIRNYLLMTLESKSQTRLYKYYWSNIEKNVGLKRMEQFMVHFLIVQRKSDSINIRRRSSKINKNTLYDCFKIYFPASIKTDEAIEELLAEMYHYSRIYNRIVNNDTPKTELEKAIHELMNELNAEPAAIFLMYLLYVQEKGNISDQEMQEAVKACISYVFRIRIFKGSISNQFFALAIQSFERDGDSLPFITRVWNALTSGQGSYRFPRDREFQAAFETRDIYLEFKPPMIRYILYKYERIKTKEVVEQENATIEHILPRDTQLWRDHLLEMRDTQFDDYKHKIGNLTLTKFNSEASNDPFESKKKIYAKSGYVITREIAEYSDWTSKEIKDRSSRMAKEAIQMWPLPLTYNDSLDTSELPSMDDNCEELFDQLRSVIKECYPLILEDQKKLYINLVFEKTILMSIVPRQSSLYVTLSIQCKELTPNSMLEDISSKGHWGVGDCRMEIKDEDDIWQTVDYIEQICKVKGLKLPVV